jgi:hypothetical protein
MGSGLSRQGLAEMFGLADSQKTQVLPVPLREVLDDARVDLSEEAAGQVQGGDQVVVGVVPPCNPSVAR